MAQIDERKLKTMFQFEDEKIVSFSDWNDRAMPLVECRFFKVKAKKGKK